MIAAIWRFVALGPRASTTRHASPNDAKSPEPEEADVSTKESGSAEPEARSVTRLNASRISSVSSEVVEGGWVGQL